MQIYVKHCDSECSVVTLRVLLKCLLKEVSLPEAFKGSQRVKVQ